MNKTYIDSGLNLIVQILQKFQVVTKEKYINPDYAIGKFQSKQTYYKI